MRLQFNLKFLHEPCYKCWYMSAKPHFYYTKFIIQSIILLYIQIKLTDIYNNNERANVLQCFKTFDQIYAKI